MRALHHELVLFQQSRNFFRYLTENDIEGDILEWTTSYAKIDLKQVADNTTHMNAEERTQLLRILEDFEDLFVGTLGDWDTDTINLELKTGSKPFNSKYYPVSRINNETFIKDLKKLVKIGV